MRFALVGVSGMLGNAAFRVFEQHYPGNVFGSVRSTAVLKFFRSELAKNIIPGIDAENPDSLISFLREVRPDVVVNCVGVVKQLASANDPLTAVPINAMLPHRLARICDLLGARLVHISTDCVFSGKRGDYIETDVADPTDLYGRSKLLGEVDYPNAVTLRTSIIGRELTTKNGLVEWLLGQKGAVPGFTKAIFSGLTTDELARVILQRVVPRPELRGVYHVSAAPISKYNLLQIINTAYDLRLEVRADPSVVIDRSLNSTRFRIATGYQPADWKELVGKMGNPETYLRGS